MGFGRVTLPQWAVKVFAGKPLGQRPKEPERAIGLEDRPKEEGKR